MCIESCPNGGILDKVEFLPLLDLLKSKSTVIAAVAPAIVGQFGENVTINQLRTAFKKLGFADMVEVAFFADMLTLKEAVEYDNFVKNERDFMITSCCCPIWVGMLKRVYDDLVKYVSPSVSPMIASGRVLKTLNPNCKVVFIGPCIAKKGESKEKDLLGDIDFVLTFTEVKDIFDSLGIIPGKLEEDLSSEYASKGGRLYGRTGGVSIAVGDAIERLFPSKYKLLKTAQAHGVRECKDILEKIKSREVSANFIEGMGCIGGCVGGPKAILKKELGKEAVDSFADKSEIKVSVDSNCMKEVLSQLQINSIEDFKDKNKIEIFEREF
jgi:iron only hydrogenase large subunit-like protein